MRRRNVAVAAAAGDRRRRRRDDGRGRSRARRRAAAALFATSDQCLACHNGMTTPSGEDVSIGFAWRGSMMANSARDPYWQAAVRRETIDYPAAAAAIEDECAACHMPMARFQAHVAGRQLEVFSRLGGGPRAAAAIRSRWTGCRARSATSFRTAVRGSSTTANSRSTPPARGASGWCSAPTTSRRRARASCIRRRGSSRRARPIWNSRSSARPATRCTRRRSAGARRDKPAARFPEQVPYLEWRASAYRPREELPGLPHDVHRRADAGGERARRAARAVRAPRIPGRELLHAGDAGTVPRRAGRRGAAPGAEPVAAADAGAAAHERRQPVDRARRASATGAWRPRSSSPTSPATSCRPRTRRAAPGSASWSATAAGGGCSRRARCAPTAASKATTTIATRSRSSRTIGSSRRPTRCRSTNRSCWTRAGA